MLTAIALGFVLGLRHAFDPDHVIAVSTLVTRHRSPWSASWVGACWGMGHSLMLTAVGALVIGLRLAVPERFALGAELGVGALLVVLGVANLTAAARSHVSRESALPLGATLMRSGFVGVAHGLAGSGALALLALAAMPTPASAFVYLLVFGLGTVLGMVGFSLALGAPLAALGDAQTWRRRLAAVTGLASLVFGVWLIHRVGFVEGLFA